MQQTGESRKQTADSRKQTADISSQHGSHHHDVMTIEAAAGSFMFTSTCLYAGNICELHNIDIILSQGAPNIQQHAKTTINVKIVYIYVLILHHCRSEKCCRGI
jgi:hypothetical protein